MFWGFKAHEGNGTCRLSEANDVFVAWIQKKKKNYKVHCEAIYWNFHSKLLWIVIAWYTLLMCMSVIRVSSTVNLRSFWLMTLDTWSVTSVFFFYFSYFFPIYPESPVAFIHKWRCVHFSWIGFTTLKNRWNFSTSPVASANWNTSRSERILWKSYSYIIGYTIG